MGSQTIETVVQILSLFSLEKGEVGVREVSQQLSIYPSRVHRLLSSLEACGLLEKGANRKYLIGERFFELGSLYPMHFPMRKIVRPHAEELAGRFQTNVHLTIPSRMHPASAIIVDRVLHARSSALVQRISLNLPLHACAFGKCILAFLPPDQRKDALQGKDLARFTPQTITNMRLLEAELGRVRKKGFAVDRGEMIENVWCIGVPLRQDQRLVAALSLSDGADRFRKRSMPEMVSALKEKADFISRQL